MKGRIALIILLAVISVFFIVSIIIYSSQTGHSQYPQLPQPAETGHPDGTPSLEDGVLQDDAFPSPDLAGTPGTEPGASESGNEQEPEHGHEEPETPYGPRSGSLTEPEPDYVMLYEAHAGAIQERREERQADLARRLATPTPPPPKPNPTPKPAATPAPAPPPPPAPEPAPVPAPEPTPVPAPEPTPVPAPEPEPESDAFLLARMIHSEAHWESHNGKIAVGQCAYDRWKNTAPASGQSGSWNPGGSKSLGGILTAAGQFVLADSEKVCSNCIAAANDVIGGAKAFPDYIITNFRPRPADDTEDWIAPYVGHIGGHAFYGYPR